MRRCWQPPCAESGRRLLPSKHARPLTGAPSIGRPIAGAKAYVLDDKLELLPRGCQGELYLGGPGLARGYLGDPALTASRFVPSPFHNGERLYRTGDGAVVMPDGQLQFLGRRDFQIKLRGHRIELAEVELAVAAEVPLAQVVVLLRADDPTSPQLVCYVVPPPGAAVSTEELAARLARRLPSAMLPAAYIVLERFPFNTSGKVDRGALPEPSFSAAVTALPTGPLEHLLAEIWCDVLAIDHVGTRDSFFALGGHSLLATRVISRLEDLLAIEIPLRTIFEGPTIVAFAVELASGGDRADLERRSAAVLEVAGIEWSNREEASV